MDRKTPPKFSKKYTTSPFVKKPNKSKQADMVEDHLPTYTHTYHVPTHSPRGEEG